MYFISINAELFILYIFFQWIWNRVCDENFCGNSGRFHVELERDDACRITASFVKGLARRQNQSRVHLTPPSATSIIRESRTYAN